jgi:FkbM family methyltransferase
MISKHPKARYCLQALAVIVLLFVTISYVRILYPRQDDTDETDSISNKNMVTIDYLSQSDGELSNFIRILKNMYQNIHPKQSLLRNEEAIMRTTPPECRKYFEEGRVSGIIEASQAQDWILYYNFFRGKTKGFYIDIGANAPQTGSVSYFFDRCLQWKGICVEAQPELAKNLREKRTCKVVNACIDSEASEVSFVKDGDHSRILKPDEIVTSGSVIRVKCMTLEQLLQENDVKYVDFMAMDIEGNEARVLDKFPFEKYSIDVINVENHRAPLRLNELLNDAGYWKITDTGTDDIYIKAIKILQPTTIEKHRNDFKYFARKSNLPARPYE